MATDYIPRPDADFLAWVVNFNAYANNNLTGLGILLPDVLPVTGALTTFQTAFAASNTARQAAQAAKQNKDATRATLETAVRALVRRLQASASVDNAERAALGITVPDAVATMAASTPTRPVGIVDTSQRLRHEIRFVDEATPTRRAKPAATMGCEIWVKVLPQGQAAPGADELEFVTLDTASPYLVEYEAADAGKTAHYMLRWVSTGGDKGPWSETVSATITG